MRVRACRAMSRNRQVQVRASKVALASTHSEIRSGALLAVVVQDRPKEERGRLASRMSSRSLSSSSQWERTSRREDPLKLGKREEKTSL